MCVLRDASAKDKLSAVGLFPKTLGAGWNMSHDGARLPEKIGDEDITKDVLVVMSKLKKYIKQKSDGFSTSQSAAKVLSDFIRTHCDDAIQNAKNADRKTVLDRDFVKKF